MGLRLTTGPVGTVVDPRKMRLYAVPPPGAAVAERAIAERLVQRRRLGVQGDRLDAELRRLRRRRPAERGTETAAAQVLGDEDVVEAGAPACDVQPGVAREASVRIAGDEEARARTDHAEQAAAVVVVLGH